MILELDKNKDILWDDIGDAIDEHYQDFVAVSPFILMLSSVIMIAGFFNQYILCYMATHITIYFYLYLNKDYKKKVVKAGAINDAEEELARAKANNEVPKDIYYISNYATVVKDFVDGSEVDSRKYSLNPENTLYEYLVTKDKYMEHTLIGGSTGSGKTVAITSSYIEPITKVGGGYIYCECKGDIPITHGALSVAAEHGREDDAYVLDFSGGASKYTHSLAPLKNGNATILLETITNMITMMKGDNAWVTDEAVKFMSALLFPLVIMRDLDLFIDAENIPKIEAENWEESFENIEKINFNFGSLRSYANYQSAINIFYLFRNLLQEDSFKEKLATHHNHKMIEDLYASYLEPLKLFLEEHGIDVTTDTITAPNYFSVIKDGSQIKQNNYAITPWSIAFSLFGNDAIYGSIVNKRYADVDFLDVMRNNKIVIVSLPSLQNSRDKNEKVGKFITSLIKAALGEMLNQLSAEGTTADMEIGKRFRPYKIPYMLLFDEISNIGNEMMGAMASMVRSIGTHGGGIGMLFAGQSEGDLKRIGDNNEYDGEQIKGNLAIKYYLNLADTYYKKSAAEQAGKRWVGDFDESVDIKKGEGDITQVIRKEELPYFTEDDFEKKIKPKTGEGVIIQKGHHRPEKVICRYVEPKEATEYKMMRNISHNELINSFIGSIEDEDNVINDTEERVAA